MLLCSRYLKALDCKRLLAGVRCEELVDAGADPGQADLNNHTLLVYQIPLREREHPKFPGILLFLSNVFGMPAGSRMSGTDFKQSVVAYEFHDGARRPRSTHACCGVVRSLMSDSLTTEY